MPTYIIVSGTAAYIAIAIICYGVFFAYWQRKYALISRDTKKFDAVISTVFALIWPIGLVGSALGGSGNVFRYGLKFNWQDEHHELHEVMDRMKGE